MAKKKISEFRPQRVNANKHTARGLGMLDKSMAENGFIGAMTSAADGEIFDGSARLETAYERFGEDVEPIIVDADGTRPIIVRRIDIPSADDPKAKKLAIAANRIASVDLDWMLKYWLTSPKRLISVICFLRMSWRRWLIRMRKKRQILSLSVWMNKAD